MPSMTNKLKCVFLNAGGDDIIKNVPYVDDEEMTDATVKAFTDAVVANGSIFTDVPISAKSASIITTTETEYDITGA